MTRSTTTWKERRRNLKRQLARLAHEDDGYTTETIIVTALLAAAAIAVVAILVAKVTGKANSINLGLDDAVHASTVVVGTLTAML